MPDLSNNQQLLQNAGARVPAHGVLVVFRAAAAGEQAPSLHPILPWLSIVCPVCSSDPHRGVQCCLLSYPLWIWGNLKFQNCMASRHLLL